MWFYIVCRNFLKRSAEKKQKAFDAIGALRVRNDNLAKSVASDVIGSKFWFLIWISTMLHGWHARPSSIFFFTSTYKVCGALLFLPFHLL